MSKQKPPDPGPVSTGPWKERKRLVGRTFPGPAGASARLRVALSRSAYAEITSHGKESLDREVCGVLAGDFCEDDEGVFVDVHAAVRGTAAREARGQVTFTQETWNSIHAAMERDHPKLQIVGWYHTHPGFGVAFSEMDVFIQRNFFSLPAQVALVMDPLGGDVGLAMNEESGVAYLDRFWVEGREHRAKVPGTASPGAGDAAAGDRASADRIAALETRVSQLVGTVHELRTSLYRFLMTAAVLLAVGIAVVVTYAVRRMYVASLSPPENVSFAPLPLTIDGKAALLGVAIVKWPIPEELLSPAPPPAPGGADASPAPAVSPAARPDEGRP